MRIRNGPTVIAKRRRLFPNFRNDIFVKKITTLWLCSDCAGIGAALSQRDQSIRFPYLSVADRRACIISNHPHVPHKIDFETARRCAIANNSYSSAEAAFSAFRNKVNDFTDRFEQGRKWGVTENILLEQLADGIRVFHEIDNALERMDLTKWILAQYKTFDVDVPATRDARK